MKTVHEGQASRRKPGEFRRAVLVGLIVMCVVLTIGAARGASKPKQPAKPKPGPAQAQPEPEPAPDMSTICIEAESGLVVSEHNADAPRPPASMVKMMLLLLVAEGLRDGRWTLETSITVSRHAQGMGGTQVYLKEGEVFTLDHLMSAVCVASANDAAMAVAEGLWGSEEAYKKRMNERAAELGMAHSVFYSVHGLPPEKGEEPDRATAREMARVAQFCVMFPLILKRVSQKELVFRPQEAIIYNTNKLLWKMEECDGMKTGFTRGAGFCITATAVRDGIRLIAVVMGANGKRDRFDLAQQLLEEGFGQVCKSRLIAKGDPVGDPVPIDNCEVPSVQLTAGDDLWVVVKKDDMDKLHVAPQLWARLQAPVRAGAALGEVEVQLTGKMIQSVPLTVSADVAEAGWRWKLIHGTVPRGTAPGHPQ